jgi:hypothetical protein
MLLSKNQAEVFLKSKEGILERKRKAFLKLICSCTENTLHCLKANIKPLGS